MISTIWPIAATSEHLGVEVSGVTFEEAAGDEDFVDFIRVLLRKHLLVLIRRQQIEPATITAFVANFGPLLDVRRAGNVARHVPGHDMIKVLCNHLGPDGVALGDGNSSAQLWHTDSTPWEAPPSHLAMYCRETTDPPPRTYFMNMIKVYESLPDATKELINDLRVIHHQYPRQIEVEIARTGASLPLDERTHGRVHPLVRRHMATNAPILYLPVRRDSIVVGWSEADSTALLEELWTHVSASPYSFGTALLADDFVIWDNSATVHSRDGWPPEKKRLMWHLSAEGEIPTPRYGSKTVNVIGLDDDQRRAHNLRAAGRADY